MEIELTCVTGRAKKPIRVRIRAVPMKSDPVYPSDWMGGVDFVFPVDVETKPGQLEFSRSVNASTLQNLQKEGRNRMEVSKRQSIIFPPSELALLDVWLSSVVLGL